MKLKFIAVHSIFVPFHHGMGQRIKQDFYQIIFCSSHSMYLHNPYITLLLQPVNIPVYIDGQLII